MAFSSKRVTRSPLWHFLCLPWWFICPRNGRIVCFRHACPSVSSYRMATSTVCSFNGSPLSGRKTSPCSITSNYYLISLVLQDKETAGFQSVRNTRIHKYCRSSLLMILNGSSPRLRLSKVNGFALQGAGGRPASDSSRNLMQHCPPLDQCAHNTCLHAAALTSTL